MEAGIFRSRVMLFLNVNLLFHKDVNCARMFVVHVVKTIFYSSVNRNTFQTNKNVQTLIICNTKQK